MTSLELAVSDLEEILFAMGELAPYDFAGNDDLRKRAYAVVTQRYALHLEWRRWPREDLGVAEPGAEFDFHPRAVDDVTIPYLILVPDDPDAVAAVLGEQFEPTSSPPPKRRWWRSGSGT